MYKDILFSVDLEHPESWKKSKVDAVQLARAFDATLHVMTVVPDYRMSMVGSFFPEGYEQKMLDAAQAKLHEFVHEQVGEEGLRVQHIVGHGKVYEEVLRVAQEISADLIILGASRPLAGQFLPGPNAARVATHAHCSVLVVRG